MLRRNVRTLLKLALVALLAVASTMLTLKMLGPSEDRKSNSLPVNPEKVGILLVNYNFLGKSVNIFAYL